MANIIKMVAILSVTLIYSCGGVPLDKPLVTAEKRFNVGYTNYKSNDFIRAEMEFRAVISEYPLSPYAGKSQLLLADTLFAMEEYEEAGSYYTTFITLHPGSENAEYALFQKAMSHMKSISSIDRDQKETRKALFAFTDLVSFYKESKYSVKSIEMIDFLRTRLAEREFYIGKFYFKGKNYDGALARFRNVLQDFSKTSVIDKTLFYIAESYVLLGEVDLARDTFLILASEYPDSPYTKKVTRAGWDS